MWSWVLHRISGASIFFFLFVHVTDTALVRVSPQAYNEIIETYKTPIIGLMELGLVAAVLYHALNGIRVILIDFWSEGPRHPAQDALGRRRRVPHRADRLGGRHRHAHGGEVPVMAENPYDHNQRSRRQCAGHAAQPRPAGQPRQPRAPRRAGGMPNFEKYAWLFMRFSGWCSSSWRSATCSSC